MKNENATFQCKEENDIKSGTTAGDLIPQSFVSLLPGSFLNPYSVY